MKTINFLKVLTVVVLPLFLSGCVILPDEQESRGVKLSDAMQVSANGDRHDVGGRSSQDYFASTSETTTASAAVSSGSGGVMDATVSYDKAEYDWQMLADVSYSLPINSQFESLTHFTLTPVAIEDEHNCFGLYLGGADVQLKSGSLAGRATDRTWMLESGLTYRYYFNHSRTALSPYITASAGFTWFNWSYRSPVISDGETFHSDSLYGAEGTLAIGISTRRDYRVSAFAEAGIGGTVFAPVTVNGFDNDVFHDFGFVSFKAGIAVKF
ncbi:MAG: hypothetical protein PHY43_03060 [Verrucomicrobiales bacterium]|nr:hypothetical protein [Verrucomicrobiales bacterium]